MSQLSLFDAGELAEVIVPKDVISPLECSKGVKTVAFRKVQDRWHEYVKSIQDTKKCSFFEARDLLIKHRDEQVPIKIKR
jgi:hypothetical protein